MLVQSVDLGYNEVMFIVGLFSWWYGAGWRQRLLAAREHIASTYDYFSIDLLVKTLFAPFRQISAGKVRGSLEVQMRAFFDRLISRWIGATVRLIVIFIGTIALCLSLVIQGVLIVAWAFVPVLPLVGMVLAGAGWMPWLR